MPCESDSEIMCCAAAYDWTLMEPKGHASSYIMDLMAFLQSIFMSFTNLPVCTALLIAPWAPVPALCGPGPYTFFKHWKKLRGRAGLWGGVGGAGGGGG